MRMTIRVYRSGEQPPDTAPAEIKGGPPLDTSSWPPCKCERCGGGADPVLDRQQ